METCREMFKQWLLEASFTRGPRQKAQGPDTKYDNEVRWLSNNWSLHLVFLEVKPTLFDFTFLSKVK